MQALKPLLVDAPEADADEDAEDEEEAGVQRLLADPQPHRAEHK